MSSFPAFAEGIAVAGDATLLLAALLGMVTSVLVRKRPLKRRRYTRPPSLNPLSFANRHLNREGFHLQTVKTALKTFVAPYALSQPPDTSSCPAPEVAAPDVFHTAVEWLVEEGKSRYMILLANAGMGKTCFALNLHAHHCHPLRGFNFRTRLLPLGIANIDNRIRSLPNREQTVLILDALDEDPWAIHDPTGRLYSLLDLTRDFFRVLITTRRRFFPKTDLYDKENDLFQLSAGGTRLRQPFLFHKRFLHPLTEQQCQKLLRNYFPAVHTRLHRLAVALLEKYPSLQYPLYFAYVRDLLAAQRSVEHCWDGYRVIVNAWLERERRRFRKADPQKFRRFWNGLAVDLYLNRQRRSGEYLPPAQLRKRLEASFNKSHWKPAKGALLKPTLSRSYAFVHRTFLEYLFVEAFIEGDNRCATVPWSDQMQHFLWENMKNCLQRDGHIPFDLNGADLRLYQRRLRHTPCQEIACWDLYHETFEETCEELSGFFGRQQRENGERLPHLYETRIEQHQQVIIDHVTGLMWQRQSYPRRLTYEEARGEIARLNHNRFAGFRDWRMPTLEEALSLLADGSPGSRCIDDRFEGTESPLWTADRHSDDAVWTVDFRQRCCQTAPPDQHAHLRAVRHAYLATIRPR